MVNSLLPQNTHSEYYGLKQYGYDWHLVFYSHDERDPFVASGDAGENGREGVIRDFMIRLQRRLKLRDNQFLFVAVSEYGRARLGHVHALISFDHLRKFGGIEKIQHANRSIEALAMEIWDEMKSTARKPARRVGLEKVGDAVADQKRILSYVCKMEAGHSYKKVFASRSLLKF